MPVVFIGSMPSDVHVMLLDPPKPDWDSFHDFALAELMVGVERDVEYELPCAPDSASPSLHFMRPSEMVRACPGVRCDGMHFLSAFPDTRCYASPGLWCLFLSHFLKCNLPQLILPAPKSHRNQSHATKQSVSSCLAGHRPSGAHWSWASWSAIARENF